MITFHFFRDWIALFLTLNLRWIFLFPPPRDENLLCGSPIVIGWKTGTSPLVCERDQLLHQKREYTCIVQNVESRQAGVEGRKMNLEYRRRVSTRTVCTVYAVPGTSTVPYYLYSTVLVPGTAGRCQKSTSIIVPREVLRFCRLRPANTADGSPFEADA